MSATSANRREVAKVAAAVAEKLHEYDAWRANRPSVELWPGSYGPRHEEGPMTTTGQATRLHEILGATNDQDWPRVRSYLADDVVHHHATAGLGSTVVLSNGVDEIVEAHRQAAEMGTRWEVIAVAEAQDLLTGIIMLHYGNGKRSFASLTYRFNAAGLVCDCYSYNERPS
jgi:hypothetical protein